MLAEIQRLDHLAGAARLVDLDRAGQIAVGTVNVHREGLARFGAHLDVRHAVLGADDGQRGLLAELWRLRGGLGRGDRGLLRLGGLGGCVRLSVDGGRDLALLVGGTGGPDALRAFRRLLAGLGHRLLAVVDGLHRVALFAEQIVPEDQQQDTEQKYHRCHGADRDPHAGTGARFTDLALLHGLVRRRRGRQTGGDTGAAARAEVPSGLNGLAALRADRAAPRADLRLGGGRVRRALRTDGGVRRALRADGGCAGAIGAPLLRARALGQSLKPGRAGCRGCGGMNRALPGLGTDGFCVRQVCAAGGAEADAGLERIAAAWAKGRTGGRLGLGRLGPGRAFRRDRRAADGAEPDAGGQQCAAFRTDRRHIKRSFPCREPIYGLKYS